MDSASPDEMLSAAAEAAIRQAAAGALGRSFEILRDERVIPRSRHRPWIRMAYDYYGHSVEGSEGALSKALADALPKRFEWRRGPAIDLPWHYPSALLEAAVGRTVSAGNRSLARYPPPCDPRQDRVDHGRHALDRRGDEPAGRRRTPAAGCCPRSVA